MKPGHEWRYYGTTDWKCNKCDFIVYNTYSPPSDFANFILERDDDGNGIRMSCEEVMAWKILNS